MSASAPSEWLRGLKQGDEVVVRHGYVYYNLSLDVVERVMPSQVILKGVRGWRFRKSDGTVISGDTMRLLQPTQALRDEIRHAALVSNLVTGTVFAEYPLAVLEQVNAVLEAHDASAAKAA